MIDLDISMQLYSIVVWGTLRIRDRGPDAIVSLRALCIRVMPGGKILAGEPDQPYSGVLEFLLTGDVLTESHHCGGRVGMTMQVDTDAELKLYGRTPRQNGRLWSYLRYTVEEGATRVLLVGQIDLRPGDRVVLSSTGHSPAGVEFATVTHVSYMPRPDGGADTWLTLREQLLHRHLSVTENHGEHQLDMKGEVSLYFRAAQAQTAPPIMNQLDSLGIPIQRTSFIRISGVKPVFNPRFRFRAFQSTYGLKLSSAYGSSTVLHGVLFSDIGMNGFRRSKAQNGINCGGYCDIRHSVLIPRLGDGIRAGDAHIENIVVINSCRGVTVDGSSHLLDSTVIDSYTDGAIVIGGCSTTVKGNAVSGAAGWGIGTSGWCNHQDSVRLMAELKPLATAPLLSFRALPLSSQRSSLSFRAVCQQFGAQLNHWSCCQG